MKTTNLENSKRLAELGVARESYFVYTKDHEVFPNGAMLPHAKKKGVAIYTACELGKMLPTGIPIYIKQSDNLSTGNPKWVCDYHQKLYRAVADTMADAMALMLIWLLESNNITAKEINPKEQP